MVNVNINSMNIVSHTLIPRLLQRDAQKRSGLINISSVCAYTEGSKDLQVYAATKAYNLSLGKSLAAAYKDRIDVLTVTPNSTKSNMSSGRYVFSILAEEFAKSTIDKLGQVDVTYGNWKHAIQPTVMATPFISWILTRENNKRRAAWKAEEEEKKKQLQNAK